MVHTFLMLLRSMSVYPGEEMAALGVAGATGTLCRSLAMILPLGPVPGTTCTRSSQHSMDNTGLRR